MISLRLPPPPLLHLAETKEIGTSGGFKVQLRRAFFDGKQAIIELAGKALYEAELADSPFGVIASLENQLRRMEEKLVSATVAEKESTERLAWLQQSLTSGFQHATKLAQLRKKQSALMRNYRQAVVKPWRSQKTA